MEHRHDLFVGAHVPRFIPGHHVEVRAVGLCLASEHARLHTNEPGSGVGRQHPVGMYDCHGHVHPLPCGNGREPIAANCQGPHRQGSAHPCQGSRIEARVAGSDICCISLRGIDSGTISTTTGVEGDLAVPRAAQGTSTAHLHAQGPPGDPPPSFTDALPVTAGHIQDHIALGPCIPGPELLGPGAHRWPTGRNRHRSPRHRRPLKQPRYLHQDGTALSCTGTQLPDGGSRHHHPGSTEDDLERIDHRSEDLLPETAAHSIRNLGHNYPLEQKTHLSRGLPTQFREAHTTHSGTAATWTGEQGKGKGRGPRPTPDLYEMSGPQPT